MVTGSFKGRGAHLRFCKAEDPPQHGGGRNRHLNTPVLIETNLSSVAALWWTGSHWLARIIVLRNEAPIGCTTAIGYTMASGSQEGAAGRRANRSRPGRLRRSCTADLSAARPLHGSARSAVGCNLGISQTWLSTQYAADDLTERKNGIHAFPLKMHKKCLGVLGIFVHLDLP